MDKLLFFGEKFSKTCFILLFLVDHKGIFLKSHKLQKLILWTKTSFQQSFKQILLNLIHNSFSFITLVNKLFTQSSTRAITTITNLYII